MARALQDILTELNSVYDPQRQGYNAQIAALDPQQAAEQSGLEQVKKDSFADITNQANRRGLFYSGLPIAEEQKYTASSFLPAVANLKAKYTTQKFNLQDAIAKVTSDQYNNAYGIRQKEVDTEEKQREFDRQLEAQAAAARASGGGYASPSFGYDPTPQTPDNGNVLGATYQGLRLRVPGNPSAGFAFSDSQGNQANALQYSQAHQIPFRTLLQQMASAGDSGAAAGLQFIGDNGNADPTKVTNQNQANLYTALTGRRIGIYRPSGPATGFPGSPGAANNFNRIISQAR